MSKLKYILIFLILITNTDLFSQIICNFKADTTYICVNTPVQFTDLSVAGSIQQWNWVFGGGLTDDIQNPIVIYPDTGTYSVSLTITDTGGVAFKIKNNYIHVREIPVADFTFNSELDYFMNDTIALSSYSYKFYNNSTFPDILPYSYFWDFGDGILIDTLDTLIYNYTSAGNYTITFIVEAGLNCSDTARYDLKVENVFESSNVFTPNKDGINDLFMIKTNGINTYQVTIFNRWGNIVYVTSAKKIVWDGYSSVGVPLEQGTYYYHIISDEIPDFSSSGFIYLFR